jgi:sulfur relay protein TusD/DsrE
MFIMGDQAKALRTAQQLLAEDASISQVFFYGAAVKIAKPSADELSLQQRWLTLQQQYHLALWLCHEAALDWGVVAEGGPQTVEPGFMLGSLGQFAEGCYRSDYLLSFGVQDDS